MTRAITNIDRTGTPGSIDARMMDPPMHSHQHSHSRTQTPPSIPQQYTQPPASPQQQQQPTQLKVKVAYQAGAFTTTLVVPISISYDLLKDRIDAKLSRTSSVSLASGHVKLKYLDEGDYISIQNDEDVQEAFDAWRESSGNGGMAEVQLFVQ
jgi:cell division control protein 24